MGAPVADKEEPAWVVRTSRWGRPVLTLVWTASIIIHLCLWGTGFVRFTSPTHLSARATPPTVPVESTFHCTGTTQDDGRCVFNNVMVKDGAVWLFTSNASAVRAIPPMLCSISNMPPETVFQCDVRVARIEDESALRAAASDCVVDTGVLFHRLNPHNPYHLLFEEMTPVYGMMREEGHLSGDAEEAVRQLKEQRWGVFISDGYGYTLDKSFYAELLPEVRVVHPSEGKACWVKRLVAGTRRACTHWHHCRQDDRVNPLFSPPDAAMTLRQLTLHRFGEPQENNRSSVVVKGNGTARAAMAPKARKEAWPRVLLVQRSSTRTISNLDEVITAIRALGNVSLSVVDFAGISPRAQLRLAEQADMFVLVHGGALGNVLWLPPGALLVDIYPYPFRMMHQSFIINSMRMALAPVGIGHHPLEIITSDKQFYKDQPLPSGCRCQGVHWYTCEVLTFWGTSDVHVDMDRFRAHIKEGLRKWREQDYEPALSLPEYNNRSAASEQEFLTVIDGVPNCL